jgi:hypothetical protein
VVARVREWRTEHEKEILLELFDFLSIPNVASNKGDIQRNADALTRMFEHRRFAPETIATSGSPVVLAERRVPGVRRTITFYFHYDGQPVVPSSGRTSRRCGHRRDHEPAGNVISLSREKIDPEWRIYGRSSSDDKRRSRVPRRWMPFNREHRADVEHPVVIEGDEEAGSPSLESVGATTATRSAATRRHGGRPSASQRPPDDALRQPAGRQRGPFRTHPRRAQRHYGNCAKSSARPGQLLASMKDDSGRVTMTALRRCHAAHQEERQAIEQIPTSPMLMQTFGFHNPKRQERLSAAQSADVEHQRPRRRGGVASGQ